MSKSGWIAAALLVAFLVIAGGVKFWPGGEPEAVAGIPDHSHDFIEHGHGVDEEITALKTEIKQALDENIKLGKLATTQLQINDELTKNLDKMGGQIEALALKLAEVQNDDGAEVRIGPGFTEAVMAANRDLLKRVENIENQPASTDEGGILRNHAGALAKIEDRLKAIDDNIRWSDKKRENDRHCHVAHSDEPFAACIKAHPAETDVTKPH